MDLQTLRKKSYDIIFKTDTYWARLFDELLIILIVMSAITIILSSVGSIEAQYGNFFITINHIITILFTIEYLVRIYVHPKPWKYIMSFYGLIDLIAIVPGFTAGFRGGNNAIILRSLRLFRLFRIFKLTKYHSTGSAILESLKGCKEKIIVFMMAVLVTVSIIGTLMFVVEGPAAGFNNIGKGIYRAIVTITTVGYGDITPVTPLGQILSSILMLIGYGIITIPTGIISAEIAVDKERKSKAEKELLSIKSSNKKSKK